MKITRYLALFITLCCLIAASGCASTRTENGVTIEKGGSMNPLRYIPFL
jgi:hypothetical protein